VQWCREKRYLFIVRFTGLTLPINLSAAELELVAVLMREMRLKDAHSISEHYDFILIDCPSSLGILSVISLVAATHVLVPIQNSVQGFSGYRFTVKHWRTSPRANRHLAFAGFIPQCTMVALHRRALSKRYSRSFPH